MPKSNYANGNKMFVNPYNFVRLDSANAERKSDTEGKDRKLLTGVLHCSFETKTPLAIPDVEKREPDKELNKKLNKELDKEQDKKSDKEHYIYPFYTIGGVPSVPGSSIRGMLRSMYETMTDSCFVTLSEHEIITNRTDANESSNVFEPAILINEKKNPNDEDNWQLYEAKRYYLQVSKDSKNPNVKYYGINNDSLGRYVSGNGIKLRNGDRVRITSHQIGEGYKKRDIIDDISSDDTSDYYLYIGEAFGKKKKYESVFKKDKKILIPSNKIDEMVNSLTNTVRFYQNRSINKNLGKDGNTGYKNFDYAKKKGAICVWHKEIRGRHYLSMAAIGRKAYDKTINKMVGVNRNPCSKRDNMCPACKLFGMSKGDSYGSKVRVTDAHVEGEYSFEGKVCLKELGSPRTGFYPFYSSDGREYDESGVTIAGRKYYWHIPRVNEDSDIYTSTEKTERNATMELMKVGTRFCFDVYYDNVTKEQLDELKWLLALPDEDGKLMHKLGHGKPLGLGSIKISIDSDICRIYNGEKYELRRENVDNLDRPAIIDTEMWKQICIISNFDTMKEQDVRYPYIEISDEVKKIVERQRENGYELKPNTVASHQWFNCFKSEKDKLPNIIESVEQALYMKSLINVDEPGNNKKGKFVMGDFQIKKNSVSESRNLGELKTGVIKVYNEEKRFGFITIEDGKDVHFSVRNVNKEDIHKLKKGAKISFYIEETIRNGEKSRTAIGCKVIK